MARPVVRREKVKPCQPWIHYGLAIGRGKGLECGVDRAIILLALARAIFTPFPSFLSPRPYHPLSCRFTRSQLSFASFSPAVEPLVLKLKPS